VCLHRFLPVLKSNWFIGCISEASLDESDLAVHLSLVCNALSLLHAVARSADVLHQLCPPASGKSTSFLLLTSDLILDLLPVICSSVIFILLAC